MRWNLSPSLRKQIYRSSPFCVYTGTVVDTTNKDRPSIEHIIPRRWCLLPDQQRHPGHLFVISSSLNHFRSDYAFGSLFGSLCPSIQTKNGWEYQNGCRRHRKRREFVPLRGHRLIAQVCESMFHQYPSLYDQHLTHIFSSYTTFRQWMDQPWTEREEILWYHRKHVLLSVLQREEIGMNE